MEIIDKLSILAVDDDTTVREFLALILSEDYNLETAKDYDEFKKILKTGTPNIILLDLTLPDGSGIEICKTLRADERYSSIFILILTASNDNATIEQGYTAGADDFIRKPVNPYELKSKIDIFGKIIINRNILHSTLASQVSLNRKLYSLSLFVQEYLSVHSLQPDHHAAQYLPEIISTGYFELVKIENGNYISLLQKQYDTGFNYRSFAQINDAHNVVVDIHKKIEIVTIKAGTSMLHAAIATLYADKQVYGYILLENNRPYTAQDKEVLSLLTDFISLMVERFSIEQELNRRNSEYKSEINKIRKVQAAIAPNFDKVPGYDIAYFFLPAQDLSGDFFDGYFLNEDIYQLLIVDVTGHGIASSYVGNQVRTLFRTASTAERSLEEIVKIVNDRIAIDLKGTYYFCTAIVCRLHLKTGTVEFLSAGHPDALLYNSQHKTCDNISYTGPLVGLFKDNNYSSRKITMNKGDTLYIYTDGIIEASNADGDQQDEQFGKDRLTQIFCQNQDLPPRDQNLAIIDAVYQYTDYCEQDDDMTAICIRKTGEREAGER
ncbi:MAG: fused response regulator/phosphatase [bacterium]|nr:fused response regulator/phosphatase [bacterium]